MKNEKLTAVTNKICELLKGTDLDPITEYYVKSTYEGFELEHNGVKITASIRLDEILAAFSMVKPAGSQLDVWKSGFELWHYDYGIPSEMWQLGKPLTDQPTEVIEFLFDVLNCE